MANKNTCCFLLIIIAVCSTQAQQQSSTSNPDEILFPGPTERPDRFPIDPQGTTTPPNTTPSAAYTQCFTACQSTSEYNPLCGTDNITYSNRGRLLCAQSCGKQVEQARSGRCETGQRVA